MTELQKNSYPIKSTLQLMEKLREKNEAGRRLSISSIQEEVALKSSQPQHRDSYLKPMPFNDCDSIDQVFISPAHMEFKDGNEGTTMQQLLTIQNRGLDAAFVRIGEPNSLTFRIKNVDSRTGYKLYPGLRVSKVVRYTYKVPSTPHAVIPIEINGQQLDYHLVCTSSSSRVAVEPLTLDFGRVNVDGLSGIRTLTLTNVGGKSCKFCVDATNSSELSINVQPARGVVRPNGRVVLGVQVSGRSEGVVRGELWIKSSPNVAVSMKIELIVPKFAIDHPSSLGSQALIDFPASFAGTQRYVNFKLTNFSSECTSFVVFDEEYKRLTSIQEIDTEEQPTFDALKICPLEGTLQPFEEILFTVVFCPTLKTLKALQKKTGDKSIDHFVAVIRISQIRAKEAKSVLNFQLTRGTLNESTGSDYTIFDNFHDSESTPSTDETNHHLQSTIYLHGDVEIPRLIFDPDTLVLGELNVGDKIQRTIRATNPSSRIPLRFAFVQKPHVRCEPRQARLTPGQSVDVSLDVQAQFNLEASFDLEFDLWSESMADPSSSNKLTSVKVSRVALNLSHTPLKARGKVIPRCCKAMPFDKLALEPDYRLTYSPSQLELKLNHREFWMHYFRRIFSRPAGDTGGLCYARDLSDYCDVARSSKVGRAGGPLSPLQMHKVKITPARLDFGEVAKGTLSHRELEFENGNDFEILVSLISADPRLVVVPEESRKSVEARSACAFSVGFHSKRSGSFDLYLNYAINASRGYELPVSARAADKKLSLTMTELSFDKGYLPQEGYRLPFEHVEIDNSLNADTKFRWSLPVNCNFGVEPRSGSVPGLRRLCACVHQLFDPAGASRAEATLQVEGGTRAVLKLDVPLKSPSVVLLHPSIALDSLALSETREASAVLYNAEYSAVFFEVNQDSLLRGVEVSPSRGCISPRGIVVLRITLKFNACVELATTIGILVQKRLTLQLQLNCTVPAPKLKFSPGEIRMKRVSTNARRVQEFSATNLGKSSVTLQFLLDEYPQFRVSLSPLTIDRMIENGEPIELTASSAALKLYLHFSPCDLASYSFDLPIVVNEILGPATRERSKMSDFLADNERYYSEQGVTCLSGATKLPIVSVSCTVAQPLLCFNKLQFEFDYCANEEEFRICNVTRENQSVALMTDSINDAANCPFTIRRTRDDVDESSREFTLKPRTQMRFTIYFKPTDHGVFLYELPIKLNDDAYNKLVLRGSRPALSIECDVLEIYLVPVALNTVAKETLKLRVKNCERATSLRAAVLLTPERCSGKFDDEALRVKFPCGASVLPCCGHELEVQLRFKSRVPVSLRARLVLTDAEGTTSTTILVHATADHSLLTTQIYQDSSLADNFVVTRDQRYSAELDEATDELLLLTSSQRSINAAASFQSNRQERMQSLESRKSRQSQRTAVYLSDITTQSSCETLLPFQLVYPFFTRDSLMEDHPLARASSAMESWLYSSVFRYQSSPSVSDGLTVALSSSSVESNGVGPKLFSFFDVLNDLADPKEDPNATWLPAEEYESEAERVGGIVKAYESALRYLTSKGACIAHVSAELLLDYDQYAILRKSDKSADSLPSRRIFASRGKHCWLDLLLQTYKCLVLDRLVDHKSLERQAALVRSAKDVDGATYASSSLNTGDILKGGRKHCRRARSEAILLAWLEYSRSLRFGGGAIDDFDACLSDGLAFVAVTLNYCPFLKDEFFADLFLDCARLDQRMHNATRLVTAWRKLRLGFVVTPAQIASPDAIQMLMLSAHLFRHLPTYLLKSKITFNCALTRSCAREISLDALDSSAQYVLQYFGSSTELFSPKPAVAVQPRKSRKLKVTYHARKILKLRVYLVLCGSAIGPTFAENQAFLLEALPAELRISGEYAIRSRPYQIADKSVEIEVPYSHDGAEYEIWLADERPSAFDELRIAPWREKMLERVPKRFVFRGDTLKVAESANTANLFVSVTCMVAEPRSIWIVFRSASDDFIVQINSNCQALGVGKASIEQSEGKRCGCSNSTSGCSGNTSIRTSTDNPDLEKCLIDSFKKCLSDEENLFWDTYLRDRVALQLVKWLIRGAEHVYKQEFRSIFK